VILNVGRQTAQKGHAHLLEALPELAARYRAHLVILGREGDASPVIERSLDLLGIRDHVTIIPYTNRVADYYANADVFVFPALMEGLGTAVIEAMAAGVPVIAFDIPPVREVVGDGRFARLVPSGDSSELFAAIDAVLAGDSDPTDMVAEARRWTEEQFDVQQIADRVFARLSTLVSAGRPSR
jgi:glycosyltransferase involved in cell wall biosynthesis